MEGKRTLRHQHDIERYYSIMTITLRLNFGNYSSDLTRAGAKHDRVIKLPGHPFSTNNRAMPYTGPIRACSISISVRLFASNRVWSSGEAHSQYWRCYETHKPVMMAGTSPRLVLRCFVRDKLRDSRPHECYTCASFVTALVAFKATEDDYYPTGLMMSSPSVP